MQTFAILLATQQQNPNGSIWMTLPMYAVFFGVLWFFFIRPQKKKQKAIQEMQNSLKVGNSVLTTGGLYGKIVDVLDEVVMIEFGTNKSVRVPVQREAIAAIREPNLSIVAKEEETEDKVDLKKS